MPICVTCTKFLPYLYTVYQSEHNLRLEQCLNCKAFADPYVEHDDLIITIDLILFKQGVYRHLLYNRGTPPFYAERKHVDGGTNAKEGTQGARAPLVRILRIGSVLVFVDAFIRWSYLNPNQDTTQPHEVSPWTQTTLLSFSRVLLACIAETFAFHSGIILACRLVSGLLAKIFPQKQKHHPLSPNQQEFRLSLIPLALFYSSLTKLFLLFLLTIWRPTSAPVSSAQARNLIWDNPFFLTVVQTLERENIGREWIIRNAVGGMSAGFGLRVILDCHPLLTTFIIVTGWIAKTSVNRVLSQWVGGDTALGDAWLAYSVP